ncbi:uncharacterized protein LOC106653112 isoform X2 [Trichogramma pretiosum]|nr:uncharacterized protein LOC106653112 isoform X2 [Trichogramma pretiosum]
MMASRSVYASTPEKLGKDNLPRNGYCPRETPSWQKKITFFIDKKSSYTNNNNGLHADMNNKSSLAKRKTLESDEESESPKKVRQNDEEDCESMDID